MRTNPSLWAGGLFMCLPLWACTNDSSGTSTLEHTATTAADLQTAADPQVVVSGRSVSFDFTDVTFLPAGVAAGESVVFIGDPLEGRVLAYSRFTGKQVGELPQPPGGFQIPFIMHALGEGKIAVLGAGGLPQPNPFVPVNPLIYEYTYTFSSNAGLSASLARVIDFSNQLIGFPEDFVQVDDGRILMTDSVLGSIWVVETDGTISPGIVPKTFAAKDAIPVLAFCPTMPEVTVNGIPFLFSGSTIPGIEPIAVRNGVVYYFSSCARGTYTFPLSILSDHRQPYQRAADIRLLAPTPADTQIEELLDFQFNPFDSGDPYLYAARGMQLQVIRLDSRTGQRQVIASDPKLFDFPSSLAFLPPIAGFESGITSLVVVSNQQERTPITNDAASEDSFNLPFRIAKVLVAP
jgi:hypothetical protein